MMADKKNYHHGHRARLRERVLRASENAVDYELAELLLGYVIKRQDTKPLAKMLLDKFGSLGGMLDARPAELRTVHGVGPAVEALFALLREIIARYAEEDVKKKQAVTLDDIGELGRRRLSACPHEEVWAAVLDNGNRLLTFEKVHIGSVSHVMISPRDAVALTLKHDATSLVLVHNHPGGSPSPSNVDVEATKRLREAMAAVGLRLLDHLILADGKYYSLIRDRVLG